MILQCHLAHTLIHLTVAAEVTFKSNVMTTGHISKQLLHLSGHTMVLRLIKKKKKTFKFYDIFDNLNIFDVLSEK